MDIQTQEPPKIEEKKCCLPCCSCSGWKIVVCVILGLLVVTGAVYAGYQIGRRSLSPRELLIPPKPIATQIPIDNGPVEIEVSPTPEVTADWKTYRNEKYKFSFKYPSNLTIRSDISRPDLVGFLEGPGGTWPQKFGFWILDNPENLELRKHVEKYNIPVPDDRTNVTYQNININGYEAILLRYELPCRLSTCKDIKITRSFSINIKGNGFVISFSVDYLPENPSGNTLEDEKFLDQILSTFRFD